MIRVRVGRSVVVGVSHAIVTTIDAVGAGCRLVPMLFHGYFLVDLM